MRDHHMTYNVVITPEASRQMEAAAGWWARERSEEQARQWYAGIRGAVATLAEWPERHPLAAEHADFGHELRELHYGLGRRATHRVIFTITKQSVVVIAVRHAAQDRLQPDDFNAPDPDE